MTHVLQGQPSGGDNSALEAIKGIKVLDVDTHLTEPSDLWTSRATAKYKDLVPRVELMGQDNEFVSKRMFKRPAGTLTPVWVVENDIMLGFAGGGSVVNKDNVKIKGSEFIQWPLTGVSPGATFVEPRLEIMDEQGIWGHIMYPNAVGFGGQGFAKIVPQLRMLCLSIWNDAMSDMHEESGGRLNGMGIVPWWDRDLAVAEVTRIKEIGIRGVNINADPQNQGLPDLSDEYYQPMWEAIAALDLPVNFHIGASVSQDSYSGTAPWPSMSNDQKLAIGSSMMYMANSRIIANFILSGLLDRNPTLKIVSVESGIGWIPFMLKALDYQADENNVTNLEMKPSEYFRRQIYACFWFEEGKQLLDDVDRVGVDNCMFETDFPHPTCLYPEPLNGIAKTFNDGNVDFETRKKLLGGNAAGVYNIELPQN
jgi:predicted TIM-barrel fold metal-dependent hydrolase